jgi:hypothetical protein
MARTAFLFFLCPLPTNSETSAVLPSRSIIRSPNPHEQFVAGVDKLVESVSKRIGKNKVAIRALWRSFLVAFYTAGFPD